MRRTWSNLPTDVEERLGASIEEEGLAPQGAGRLQARRVRRPGSDVVVDVKNFPLVVMMDVHGQSKHSLMDVNSQKVLDDLLARP